MTPEEYQLVAELFDRLAKLEISARDADVERAIAEGLRKAPHALYALVQAVLVQDEALKRANARIEALQTQLGAGAAPPQRSASFLDSVREAFGVSAPTRGSVPSVGALSQTGYSAQPDEPQPTPPPDYPVASPFGTGGSFLGAAASTAAGVIGGALLLDGIRAMFGLHARQHASPLGSFAEPRNSPWSDSAADSQLARDAGIERIGRRPSESDPVFEPEHDALLDVDDEDAEYFDDEDFGDDWNSGDDGYDV